MAWTQKLTPYGAFKCKSYQQRAAVLLVIRGWFGDACVVIPYNVLVAFVMPAWRVVSFSVVLSPPPYTYHPSIFGFLFHWYLGVTSACFLNSRPGGSWLGSWPWKHCSVLGLAANSGNPWISQALAFLNISGQACTVISIIFRCLGIISLGHKLHQFSASVAARFTLLRAFNPEYYKPGFGCFKSYPLRTVHPQTG